MREFKPDIVHTHTAKAGALGPFGCASEGVRHRSYFSWSCPFPAIFAAGPPKASVPNRKDFWRELSDLQSSPFRISSMPI